MPDTTGVDAGACDPEPAPDAPDATVTGARAGEGSTAFDAGAVPDDAVGTTEPPPIDRTTGTSATTVWTTRATG